MKKIFNTTRLDILSLGTANSKTSTKDHFAYSLVKVGQLQTTVVWVSCATKLFTDSPDKYRLTFGLLLYGWVSQYIAHGG